MRAYFIVECDAKQFEIFLPAESRGQEETRWQPARFFAALEIVKRTPAEHLLSDRIAWGKSLTEHTMGGRPCPILEIKVEQWPFKPLVKELTGLVEQGTHKPLVVSSTLTLATSKVVVSYTLLLPDNGGALLINLMLCI